MTMPEPMGETGPQDPLHVLDEFLASLNAVDRATLVVVISPRRLLACC